MVDFKEKFKELIEHTFIPSTASSVVKTKAWHNIYNLLIPNIPEKLYYFFHCPVYSYQVLMNILYLILRMERYHYVMLECFPINMILTYT